MKKVGLILGMIIVSIAACKKDKATDNIVAVEEEVSQTFCDTVTISFANHIQPIFIQSCATSGCHNSGTASSGYIFENYTQISNEAKLTQALKTIKYTAGYSPMPKLQPKLNDSLIQQIECWIAQGRQNN